MLVNTLVSLGEGGGLIVGLRVVEDAYLSR